MMSDSISFDGEAAGLFKAMFESEPIALSFKLREIRVSRPASSD
jgi:hypothetical protein